MELIRVIPKPKPVKIKHKKRKVKTSRQLLELQLDQIVREIVLARDSGCVCAPPKNGHSIILQPGHLISRKNKLTRWDLYCVNCQCSSCNLLHNYKPEIYTQWFLEKWGVETYTALVFEARGVGKYQEYELIELLEQLRKIRQKQIEDLTFKPYFTQKEILSGAWEKK